MSLHQAGDHRVERVETHTQAHSQARQCRGESTRANLIFLTRLILDSW